MLRAIPTCSKFWTQVRIYINILATHLLLSKEIRITSGFHSRVYVEPSVECVRSWAIGRLKLHSTKQKIINVFKTFIVFCSILTYENETFQTVSVRFWLVPECLYPKTVRPTKSRWCSPLLCVQPLNIRNARIHFKNVCSYFFSKTSCGFRAKFAFWIFSKQRVFLLSMNGP